ncbi:hypothetical protein E2C01_052465 [Portunus trituberculatus]|uniref:Uncharacterized protein n=1 Tax=Portunus trituberculatus TaxID=210409 RepID=A0A5B7GEL5_PORTR|nr:hypothetical protein [Portunus trituberculatus]
MLKHASPLRSSPGQSRTTPDEDAPAEDHLNLRDSYSERGVDCDSLVVPSSFAQAEKAAGYQVGTWSGVSQASVRRGLSFSSRRAPDAISFRSVRSEGQPASPDTGSPANSSMTSVAALRREEASQGCEGGMQYMKGDMPSLKSLLRLPGVRGHARIIEVTKDGVLLSPETLSLNSADSFFSAHSGRTSSRSWSSNASSNSSGTNASSGSNSSTSEPTSNPYTSTTMHTVNSKTTLHNSLETAYDHFRTHPSTLPLPPRRTENCKLEPICQIALGSSLYPMHLLNRTLPEYAAEWTGGERVGWCGWAWMCVCVCCVAVNVRGTFPLPCPVALWRDAPGVVVVVVVMVVVVIHG